MLCHLVAICNLFIEIRTVCVILKRVGLIKLLYMK